MHRFKNFPRGSMPPNPPSNTHGFAMRSICRFATCKFPNLEKKFLAPPSQILGTPLSLLLRLLVLWRLEMGGIGCAKILQKIMGALSDVIKINKFCGVGGVWGHWGGAKILQKIMVPPLSVIKINKYCSVGQGRQTGGGWGGLNPP